MTAGITVPLARRAIFVATALVILVGAKSSAGTAVVSAPTGPPELLVRGHNPLTTMDREGYEKELERLASRTDLVPVREWPDGLEMDAPLFITELVGPLVTLALRGDVSSGFELLADRDANGKLDEPPIPFRKDGDGWSATFRVEPPVASNPSDPHSPTWIEARWEQISFQDPSERVWRLMICRINLRRGVIELAGRKTAFAIAGEVGAYGRDSQEIFFDLNGDGGIEFDSPYDAERFEVKEERVVVGHTAYRFTVDPRGDAITLTRLEGRFEPRTNLGTGARAPELTLTDFEGRKRRLSEFRGSVVLLDFWSTGCAPCIWEMPKLAALRRKYQNRRFEILGVHVGPTVPETATICASKGAVWPQLVDATNEVAGRYRVDRYPTTFLLDRKGRILDHDLRGQPLEAAVEAAVGR